MAALDAEVLQDPKLRLSCLRWCGRRRNFLDLLMLQLSKVNWQIALPLIALLPGRRRRLHRLQILYRLPIPRSLGQSWPRALPATAGWRDPGVATPRGSVVLGRTFRRPAQPEPNRPPPFSRPRHRRVLRDEGRGRARARGGESPRNAHSPVASAATPAATISATKSAGCHSLPMRIRVILPSGSTTTVRRL